MKISKSELRKITANYNHPLMSLLVDLIVSKVYGDRDVTLNQFIRTISDVMYKDCPQTVLDALRIESEIMNEKIKDEKKSEKTQFELNEEADRKEITDFQEVREEYMDWWYAEIRKREKRQAERQHKKYRSEPGLTKDYIILENVTGHNFKTETLDEICGNIHKLFNADKKFWDVALWNDHYTAVTSPKRPDHKYKNAKRLYEMKYNEMCRLPEEKLLLSKNRREDGSYIQPYGYIQHQIREMLLHYDRYHPVFVGKKYHIRKMLKLGAKYDCVVGYIVVSDDYKTAKYYDRAEELMSDINYEDSEKSKVKYEKETLFAHIREDEKLGMSFNNFDMNEYESVAHGKGFGNVNSFGRHYDFPNYAGPKMRYSSVSYDVPTTDGNTKHIVRQSCVDVDDAATLEGVSYMSDNYQKYVNENYSNAPKNIEDIVNSYKISMRPQDFKTAGNVFCPCCLEKGEFNLVYWSLTEGYSDCRVCKCKIPNPSVIIDRDATVFADIDADRQDMVNSYYAKFGSFDPKYRDVRSTPWDLGDTKDDKDGATFTDNVVGSEIVNDGVTPEGITGSFVDRVIRSVDKPVNFRKPHAIFKDGSKTIIFRK